ncbi:MAG: ATP-dependent 6-phosphofructokinase [Clostridia bacterium]
MRVGVLTSGGDAPGMNTFIERFFRLCKKNNIEVFAVRKGFQGLIDDEIDVLEEKEVKNIGHLGGSALKCFRSEEFKTSKGFKKAVANVFKHQIDVLIGIGGNGTFVGLEHLSKAGVSVIAVPATIDNDLFFSEHSLGFDTALNNAVEAIDKIKQTMDSAGRAFAVEVMGRECSSLAVNSFLAANGDFLITSDVPFCYDTLKKQIKLALKQNKDFAPVVIVQENCVKIFDLVKDLQNDLDIEFRANILGYVQRGGSPSVFDRIFALKLAVYCLSLLKDGKKNRAIGEKCNVVFDCGIDEVEDLTRKIDNNLINFLQN